ncbi:MAG: S-layer homology domain-containing protein, partial [Lachnospiraceae bacterium]|nr:S-layer homology domain-containing protein [Lachnospiraceae bacterium]
AGALSGEVIDATLRMLNYGRWQAGLNPVSLRTEYMERSQKGAVILRALNRLTHTPSQPADMDDDFYHEAYAGVNAAADYTGNCSYGDTLPESIFGYLDDTANLEAGSIGHRLSLLDPRATGTSFGYCESYSALSMYISPAATDNRESYYAWPSAGYFPVEDIDANALWHITTGWYMYSNPAVTLTYDGTDYAAEDLEYDDYYSAFSFRAPDALREQIAGGGRYLPGTTVTVTLTGLYNEEGEEVIVTYPVMFFEPLFRDVTDPEQFYFDPVYWAADEGITTGWSDNTFRPMNNCNRASVVTFLWRMAGRPEPSQMASFTDMTGNTEFDKAISWAAENGITTGWSDGTFRPWNTCNRASIVTFLWRFAGRPEPEGENTFSDKTGDPEFDLAIAWAAGNGITTGWSDGTFRPWNTCNRLAVVSFLYRYAHPQG